MYNLLIDNIRGKIPLIMAVMLHLCVCAIARAQVDYTSQVQPIFTRSCEGGFCHIGMDNSGIDLSSYDAALASFGFQYDGATIVPGDSQASPLWLKIAQEEPQFGARMPRLADPLSPEDIDLIARWIDEGAVESIANNLRGDLDRDGGIALTDAIIILRFLFIGGADPFCEPVADANSRDGLDITDAIYLLDFLFLGGPPPPPLSPAELEKCAGINRPPAIEPIGTIIAREGAEVSFQLIAEDPDNDDITYSVEAGPEGLTIDPTGGSVSWTPSFGQEGDHRIELRASDDGQPPLSTIANGLIRVLQGNLPPSVEEPGTI